MNTQIVDAIAQLIKTLPEENLSLLRNKFLTDLFIPILNTQTSPPQNIQINQILFFTKIPRFQDGGF